MNVYGPSYVYHFCPSRKYSQLQVQYTRLQQGPVRFTFTAQGEMMEEEDDLDDINDPEAKEMKQIKQSKHDDDDDDEPIVP